MMMIFGRPPMDPLTRAFVDLECKDEDFHLEMHRLRLANALAVVHNGAMHYTDNALEIFYEYMEDRLNVFNEPLIEFPHDHQ